MEASRILIVDKAGAFRAMLKRVLKDTRNEVVCVDTGVEALDLTTRSWFDVIFINTSLPDMDGVNLVRYLTTFKTGAITVVMTINRSYHSALAALEAGASRYLLLPFQHTTEPSRVVREAMAERVLLLRRRYSLRLVDLGLERHLLETEGRIAPVRVIVADPDDEGRHVLADALCAAGCAVRHYPTAREALKNLEPSEIIAMAYDMGDLEALDALRKIRAWRGLVDVVIYGGQPSLGEITDYIRYGTSAYIERHLDVPDMTSYLVVRHGRAVQVNRYVGSLEKLFGLLPQVELGSYRPKGLSSSVRSETQSGSECPVEAVEEAWDAGASTGSEESGPTSLITMTDEGTPRSGRLRPSPGYYSQIPSARRSKIPDGPASRKPKSRRDKPRRLRPSVGFYHINEPDDEE